MKKEQSTADDKTEGVIRRRHSGSPQSLIEAHYMKSLTVHIGGTAHKVFLTYGFHYHRNDFSTYHTHSSYHEIIIIIGECELIVGDKILKLEGSNMIAMPPKVFHKLITTENVEACTFFVDTDIAFALKALPEEIARALFKESERVLDTNDYSKVAPYISLILSYFLSGEKSLEPEPANDYAFLIDSFFNFYYMDDIRLEALADYLHVSLTHAHRLVQKHTGVTFTEELIVRRLSVANFLVNCRGMNLTEAAAAVGFRSYTAFWKARQKYKGKF